MCDPNRCNWCGNGTLLQGKPYCDHCFSQCFRECKRCKKPFPNPNFFTTDTNYCDACVVQREKQIQNRLKQEENNRLILLHLQPTLSLQTKIQQVKIPKIKPVRKKRK